MGTLRRSSAAADSSPPSGTRASSPQLDAKKHKVSSGTLQPGTRCVHPQHGVAEISGIVDREAGGSKVPFYELKLVASDGKVFVPVAAAERAGLRPIMSAAEADGILDFMKTKRAAPDSRPFQKRMRIYGEMLRSGDRYAIAEVLRDMHRTSFGKDLSFGERKLLTQARAMLVTELAMAKHTSVETMEHTLEEVFAA